MRFNIFKNGTLDGISDDIRYGIYVVKSDKYHLGRLGSSGTGNNNNGQSGLLKRLSHHADQAPNGATNDSLFYQPWKIVWACGFISETCKRRTLFIEKALFGHFAGHYTFQLSSKGESIFSTRLGPDIFEHACSFEPRLEAIIKCQEQAWEPLER